MADERQPPNIVRCVEAPSTFGSRRWGNEHNPLIVADRLDIDASALGQSSDGEHQQQFFSGYRIRYSKRPRACEARTMGGEQVIEMHAYSDPAEAAASAA